MANIVKEKLMNLAQQSPEQQTNPEENQAQGQENVPEVPFVGRINNAIDAFKEDLSAGIDEMEAAKKLASALQDILDEEEAKSGEAKPEAKSQEAQGAPKAPEEAPLFVPPLSPAI